MLKLHEIFPSEYLNWAIISGVLDVLLVSFLIYRLILLVRGTRAEAMLLGLGIVMLVYLISDYFSLSTLEWILGNFLGSVILVIVVLFQDDLRRGLTKVGLVPGLGSPGTSRALQKTIREVSKAAVELSERCVGALFVIKASVGLEEYTEHAIQIDALVSHQLLVSIFLPNSPIHDGAVIIDGERIVASGAVLPLSFDPSLSSSYGTRHRAAIGLTERTDAVVVVVSEESGKITLFSDTKVVKNLDELTLADTLRRFLSQKEFDSVAKKDTRVLEVTSAKEELDSKDA